MSTTESPTTDLVGPRKGLGARTNGASAEPKVDPRNTLNDLTGPEWLPETKSFFFQKGLGAKHPHAQIEREHPAPFSFQDIQRLVAFFTKRGALVLDPFSGVASTAKACALLGRRSTGIELSPHWHSLAEKRLETEVDEESAQLQELVQADARTHLKGVTTGTVDFVVTSPPYWSILNKDPDHKARERADQDLALSYSEDAADLGNVADYGEFLDELTSVFNECGRVLKPKGYMAIVVADFRHGSRFYPFHADLIQRLDQRTISPKHTLALQGIKVLLQNHKSLKPYGYPFSYVENIHHHNVLIFQKRPRKD
jgi:DNA modification methylase